MEVELLARAAGPGTGLGVWAGRIPVQCERRGHVWLPHSFGRYTSIHLLCAPCTVRGAKCPYEDAQDALPVLRKRAGQGVASRDRPLPIAGRCEQHPLAVGAEGAGPSPRERLRGQQRVELGLALRAQGRAARWFLRSFMQQCLWTASLGGDFSVKNKGSQQAGHTRDEHPRQRDSKCPGLQAGSCLARSREREPLWPEGSGQGQRGEPWRKCGRSEEDRAPVMKALQACRGLGLSTLNEMAALEGLSRELTSSDLI